MINPPPPDDIGGISRDGGWRIEPPSWPTLRRMNAIMAGGCAAAGFAADEKWIAMLFMAVAGFALASAIWISFIIKQKAMLEMLAEQIPVLKTLHEKVLRAEYDKIVSRNLDRS